MGDSKSYHSADDGDSICKHVLKERRVSPTVGRKKKESDIYRCRQLICNVEIKIRVRTSHHKIGTCKMGEAWGANTTSIWSVGSITWRNFAELIEE
jgi:hypothetical protein